MLNYLNNRSILLRTRVNCINNTVLRYKMVVQPNTCHRYLHKIIMNQQLK